MRQSEHKYQFAKILVFSDEYPLLSGRKGKQLFVCGSGVYLNGRYYIVSQTCQSAVDTS